MSELLKASRKGDLAKVTLLLQSKADPNETLVTLKIFGAACAACMCAAMQSGVPGAPLCPYSPRLMFPFSFVFIRLRIRPSLLICQIQRQRDWPYAWTPLSIAAAKGHDAVVSALLDAKASCESTNAVRANACLYMCACAGGGCTCVADREQIEQRSRAERK